jgi:ribosome-associated toxin RatA of RatAB toxin-antitoxin module
MRLALLVLAAVSVPVAVAAAPRMVELQELVSRAELQALAPLLARGELSLVQSWPSGRLRQVTVLALIPAPPSRVWAALTDYAAYPEFMPNVASVEILGRQGQDTVVHYELEVPGTNVEYTLRHRHQPEARVDIWLEDDEGDIRTGGWRWELVPHDGGKATLVLYHLYTDVRESSWIVKQMLSAQPAMEHGLNVATGLVTVQALQRRVRPK